MPPKSLAAGNWKMHGTLASLQEIESLVQATSDNKHSCDVLICPSFIYIAAFAERTKGTNVMIGAQDCHAHASGAHTGDVSANQLADVGASHVIVGHSERRADHTETSEQVHAKAAAVHEAGLISIVCVGETESERDASKAEAVVTGQIIASVPDSATPENTVIAYEPVWAIGTGRTPTVKDVADMHDSIRATLIEQFGQAANGFSILYGGSVKPANAKELMSASNVNGALVGGASLKAEDFNGIIDAYR